MNVVDSSGWLEYVSGGPNAAFFAPPIEDSSSLLVPTISLYEVYKRVLRERGDILAEQVASTMSVGRVIDVNDEIALLAARMSVEMKLSMADSILIATARYHRATFWTQDADFKGLSDVRYIQTG
ncbi:MAG: type II toxin-antitoxin system VapC family toxin [Anaerolineae bacterium]